MRPTTKKVDVQSHSCDLEASQIRSALDTPKIRPQSKIRSVCAPQGNITVLGHLPICQRTDTPKVKHLKYWT
jgi:hypothetical protein